MKLANMLGSIAQMRTGVGRGDAQPIPAAACRLFGPWPLLLIVAMGASLCSADVSIHIPAQTLTRTTDYTYFASGLPETKTLEAAGGDGLKLVTSFTYSAAGNKLTETAKGWNGKVQEERTQTSTWDVSNRFPNTRTNAKQQPTDELEHDPRFGGVIKQIGINLQMTKWEYDDFGRKTFERRGYASKTATTYTDYTSWTYERCADVSGGCAAVNGVSPSYVVTAETKAPKAEGSTDPDKQIAPTVKVFYDTLNREIRTETQALGDANAVTTVYRDTQYDTKGNVWKVSQPYFSGGTAKWTELQYDDLGRKTKETAPNGLVTLTSYSGLETTTTVQAETNRVTVAKQNALGLLIESMDASSRTSYYVYDAQGSLTHTVNPYGDKVVVGYDLRGRKKSLIDPDMGEWSYTPNAFGEVVTQTNSSLNKTSEMEYDLLGRMTKRGDPDLVTKFEYDTATNGKGRLAKVDAANGYCRTHSYDSMSRPSGSTLKIGAGTTACTNPTETWVAETSYDSVGRVDTQTFPSGLKTQQGYHATLGTLLTVTNQAGGSARTVYWTRTKGDAAGRSTGYTYGNTVATLMTYDDSQMGWLKSIYAGKGGVELAEIQLSKYDYDKTGQLAKRQDKFDLPMVECSKVDALGRLTRYWRDATDTDCGTPNAATLVTVDYDAIGRIKSKTDVGTYYYAGVAAGATKPPHGVTAVRGAITADYDYDAGGNMKTGNGVTYLFSDSGLLRMAGKGSTCQEFLSQGEGMRWLQTIYGAACKPIVDGQSDNSASAVLAKTLYMHPDASNGLSYEREAKFGSSPSTSYKHYITVGGRPVALVVSNSASVAGTTPVTVSYLHYDHLGSVVAISDSTGVAVSGQRRSFDPWGRARELNGTPGTGELPGGLAGEATDRGYTLHEHLEGLGLIHMNGRIFDPLLARFTSADPMVSSPHDLQSYDRYAYVMNRPLDASDPSGYVPIVNWGASASGGSNQPMNIGFGASFTWTFGGGTSQNGATANGAGSGFPGSGSTMPYNMTVGEGYLDKVAANKADVVVASTSSRPIWPDLKEALLLNDIERVIVTGQSLAKDIRGYFGPQHDTAVTSIKDNGPAYASLLLLPLTKKAPAAKAIATPYGVATQSKSVAALAARADVQEGATLYRIGTTGKSQAAEAQFWSLEHPLSPGYAGRYGLPAENVANANFIEAATLKTGAPFVTRPAPGIGQNVGGGIEVVVPSGAVQMKWFTGTP